jgi:Zn-dependent peptidase ImmA (M78 family)
VIAVSRSLRPTCTLLDEAADFAMRKAKRLLKDSRMTAPPFLPERLASFRGIRRIVREDIGQLSGLLLPMDDGFEIKINVTHSPERQSFSCAHEIAHTFFLEPEGKTIIAKLKRENGEEIAKNREEDLCDAAASELLMPLGAFTGCASRYHFDPRSLMTLSRTFNISIVPCALKLCDTNPRFSFLVHWSPEQTAELGGFRLRPTWLTWSRKRMSARAGRFLFNQKVSRTSGIEAAYLSDKATYSRERVVVGRFAGECQIWAQGFLSGSSRFVMSFVFPECKDTWR